MVFKLWFDENKQQAREKILEEDDQESMILSISPTYFSKQFAECRAHSQHVYELGRESQVINLTWWSTRDSKIMITLIYSLSCLWDLVRFYFSYWFDFSEIEWSQKCWSPCHLSHWSIFPLFLIIAFLLSYYTFPANNNFVLSSISQDIIWSQRIVFWLR